MEGHFPTLEALRREAAAASKAGRWGIWVAIVLLAGMGGVAMARDKFKRTFQWFKRVRWANKRMSPKARWAGIVMVTTAGAWWLLTRTLGLYAYHLSGKQRADYTYKAAKYWNREAGEVGYWRPEGTYIVDDPTDEFSADKESPAYVPFKLWR